MIPIQSEIQVLTNCDWWPIDVDGARQPAREWWWLNEIQEWVELALDAHRPSPTSSATRTSG